MIDNFNYTSWAIKTCHSLFVHNFKKCWPILKILSLLDSAANLQQGSFRTSYCALNVSLHYPITVLLVYLIQYHRFAVLLIAYGSSWIILNVQNALVNTTRPETFVPLIHCIIDDFDPRHARPLSDAASVHRHDELDECRKCFRACIHSKGGHFSI